VIVSASDVSAVLPDQVCQFDRILALEGEVYRNVSGRKTLRFSRDGKSYFLKVHLGVGWKEIIKNLVRFRLPVVSAKTEWRALHRLKALRVETLTPVAYGCEGWNPARLRSFLITEDLGETVMLSDVLSEWKRKAPTSRDTVRLKRALLEKIADIARTLHENGVNHRDFYLCHLRVPVETLAAPSTDQTRVYVMDLHRAQMRRRTPARWIIKDLGSLFFSSLDLGLTRRDLYRFMRAYDRQTLRTILTIRSRFWGRVEGRAFRLYGKHHGSRSMQLSDVGKTAVFLF
jgi:hypothetical protein